MTRIDEQEFARFYDQQVWRVYGFFGYRVNSGADAEDLTQLTFERALRSWRRFDPRRASAQTWVMAIARNLLIDHYRAARLRSHRSLDDDATGAALEPVAEEKPETGLSAELWEALSRLHGREREVIALRFGGELNGPEIAELTGLSVGNVQQIMSRSLRRLRAELEPARYQAVS